MSLLNRFVILNLIALSTAAIAAAGGPEQGKPGGQPARSVSWEELKDRCAHPENYDVQRQPQNIVVQCTDNRLTWNAAAPGEVPLSGQRMVTTGVFSDKFYVNADRREFPVAMKSGSCLRFKEIEEQITIERPVSCAEVLGIKGDLGDFCGSALDTAKGSNPKQVQQRETGRMIDTCGGTQQGGKPGPGPKFR